MYRNLQEERTSLSKEWLWFEELTLILNSWKTFESLCSFWEEVDELGWKIGLNRERLSTLNQRNY